MIRAAGFVLLAYLCGSVPTGYLAGRRAGLDLRERGSGNLGSSNVYRVLGAGAALPVLAVDVLKGFVPVWFFPLHDGTAAAHLPLLYATAAIAGHVWSGFLRFQGGKGIATAAGVVLALSPVAGIVGVLAWLGLVLITGAPSVASLSVVTLLPVLAWGLDDPAPVVGFIAALVPFAWWTHRENVARLRRGDELLLGGGLRGREAPDGGTAEGASRGGGDRGAP